MLVVVDGIDTEGTLLGDGLPDVLHRFFHGGRLAHRHHVGGHETSRRVFGVLEDFLDFLRPLLFHEVEDFLRVLRGELIDDVGRVLRGHAIEDLRDFDVVEGAHEPEEGGVVELGEDVSRRLGSEGAKDRGAIRGGQMLQHVRDVRRVRFGERLPRARIVPVLQQLFR